MNYNNKKKKKHFQIVAVIHINMISTNIELQQ